MEIDMDYWFLIMLQVLLYLILIYCFCYLPCDTWKSKTRRRPSREVEHVLTIENLQQQQLREAQQQQCQPQQQHQEPQQCQAHQKRQEQQHDRKLVTYFSLQNLLLDINDRTIDLRQFFVRNRFV